MNSFIKLVTAFAMTVAMSSHAADFNGSELQKYFEGKVSKEEIAQQLTEEPEKFEVNFTVLRQSVFSVERNPESTKALLALEDEINKQVIEYNSNREPQFAIKLGGAVIGAVVAFTAVYRGMGAHQAGGDYATFIAKGFVTIVALGAGAAAGGVVYVSIDQLLEKPHILPSTTRLLNYIE